MQEHLLPRVQLVIAGRVDPPLPLARLRARGQLAEIRAAELRFTPDEAVAFFREVMGLDLTAAAVLAAPEGYVRIFLDEGAPMLALLRQAAARGIMLGYVRTLLAGGGAPPATQ